jgi:hypothetical protein
MTQQNASFTVVWVLYFIIKFIVFCAQFKNLARFMFYRYWHSILCCFKSKGMRLIAKIFIGMPFRKERMKSKYWNPVSG